MSSANVPISMRGTGKGRFEVDYVRVAAEVRSRIPPADLPRFKSRDIQKAVHEAIETMKKRLPGARIHVFNRPGQLLSVEGDRVYLINRDGTLTQLKGEPLPLGGGYHAA